MRNRRHGCWASLLSAQPTALWRYPIHLARCIKKRLAVVVSSDDYNRLRPDIIIMAVTSQMRSADYFGDVGVSDWKQAGLLKPSVIKPIFTTIEKNLVIKQLGRISDNDRANLAGALREIIGK